MFGVGVLHLMRCQHSLLYMIKLLVIFLDFKLYLCNTYYGTEKKTINILYVTSGKHM